MGNVFCYSAETLEKVMPIRTLSMIALTVYFDWIKEKAVWNGENVQLKASFKNIIKSIYIDVSCVWKCSRKCIG